MESAETISPTSAIKDLIQVFFGLVLTQIALYATGLVEAWRTADAGDYAVAASQLVLAFGVTVASWFGSHMASEYRRFDRSCSIFQRQFVLAMIDIVLVGLYFLLVRTTEIQNVTTFSIATTQAAITAHDAFPELVLMMLIFALDAFWDLLSWPDLPANQRLWPIPAILCWGLTMLAIMGVLHGWGGSTPSALFVCAIDGGLLLLAFFFRALKRLQLCKQAHRHKTPGKAPRSAHLWTWLLAACVVLFALVAHLAQLQLKSGHML